jgi:hypothetical protein
MPAGHARRGTVSRLSGALRQASDINAALWGLKELPVGALETSAGRGHWGAGHWPGLGVGWGGER